MSANVRGKQIVQYGVYKEVDAPHRFVRTERWEDWDPGETLVTVDLVDAERQDDDDAEHRVPVAGSA